MNLKDDFCFSSRAQNRMRYKPSFTIKHMDQDIGLVHSDLSIPLFALEQLEQLSGDDIANKDDRYFTFLKVLLLINLGVVKEGEVLGSLKAEIISSIYSVWLNACLEGFHEGLIEAHSSDDIEKNLFRDLLYSLGANVEFSRMITPRKSFDGLQLDTDQDLVCYLVQADLRPVFVAREASIAHSLAGLESVYGVDSSNLNIPSPRDSDVYTALIEKIISSDKSTFINCFSYLNQRSGLQRIDFGTQRQPTFSGLKELIGIIDRHFANSVKAQNSNSKQNIDEITSEHVSLFWQWLKSVKADTNTDLNRLFSMAQQILSCRSQTFKCLANTNSLQDPSAISAMEFDIDTLVS